ncbi:MAG: protein-L-isoaspartate(D-aspartate) O-methyltransferase [Deltaproteobacteria bacterium]|nr:protein-L-isoaspartate(D-aspartate) O-methyltransferase [Deltaproteobacteria bacterium]
MEIGLTEYVVARRRMVEEQIRRRGISDPRVLAAMLKVPRHRFVDPGLEDQAYGDNPLGIGEGQTISQPYIVALMTEALGLTGREKILEIGTGCGYQTAILSELAAQVYTIERIKNLGLSARRNLKNLGCRNIVIRVGDGSMGWPEAAPFDGILIAAGSPEIPKPLTAQLAVGGKMVVPVGTEENQHLMRITRREDNFSMEDLGECRFVKLVGEYGWRRKKEAGDKFLKRSVV